MASIVKRKRAKGHVYCVVYQLDGRQIWETIGPKWADANDRKTEIEHGIFKGTHQRLPDITFKELAEKWLELKKGQVRPKTYGTYKPHAQRLIDEFGRQKVKAISQEAIEQFAARLNEGDLAGATAGRCITIAGSIFKKGMQWGYLSRNPAEFVEKPKAAKPEIDFLEPDEIRRLIDATEEQHRCLILFACLTGSRQSEILGLRWSDTDLAAGRVYIRQVLQGNQFFEPKTDNSKRAIDLPASLVDELKQHQARQAIELEQNPHNLVFTSRTGTPMISRNVTQRIFEPALKRAELRKVGFHSLRHSYVSMLINQGENVKTIQALVGHASAKMTWDIYGHLFEGETKRAVARLEEAFSRAPEVLPAS